MEKLNRKKVAALIRLLSSDQPGEVSNCVSVLKKICNLNELGDFIEGLGGSGNGKLSKEQMREIYDTGFEDGRNSELRQKKTTHDVPPWEDVSVFGTSSDEYKVKYCNTHKDKLKKQREKEFIDNMINWTTVRQKPLTEAQKKWINDIYSRLGGV